MTLYYYSGGDEKKSAKVLGSIENAISSNDIRIFTTIDSFSRALREFRNTPIMTVILTSCRADLMNILLLKDLLADIPMLLILPDKTEETIAKGTQLRPRFIYSIEDDLSPLLEILRSMIQKYNI